MENIISPLFLEGWQAFNNYKWGLTPKRAQAKLANNKDINIDYVVYFDRRNKIRMPKFNNYLPMQFNSTRERKIIDLRNQWLYILEELVKEFTEHGLANAICLTPNIADIRIFQWHGYIVEPRFTYLIDFPYDVADADYEVRRRINKCTKNNFRFERTNNFSDVFHCITATADRKNINLYLTKEDLKMAQQLIGEEYFRAYVSYTSQGMPASASIMLHYPGCKTFYWMAGTVSDQLHTGVSQYNIYNSFMDLQKAGATGVDFGSATSAKINKYKNAWGGHLVPYYMVMEPGWWSISYHMYRKIFSAQLPHKNSFLMKCKHKVKALIDKTVVKKVI